MTKQFPLPPTKILERLLVTDGLLMNADRWRIAHEYHRQRQNIHYQSLNQPGIVSGLGVRLISAPAEVPTNYRDRRWIQIQPGIAIDITGNPIIVPQPETYRIATQAQQEKSLTVYLVISYVDPERLRRPATADILQETFRIDEKLTPPGETEVELCRILLPPGKVELENPADVFFLAPNQLDLRYRHQVRSRPQATVRVAQIANSAATERSADNLSYLLQSISGLYPALNAQQIEPINLEIKDINFQIQACDLLFLATCEAFTLNQVEFAVLKNYLDSGGVLLIDTPNNGDSTIGSILDLAEQLGTPLQDIKKMKLNHPLRTEPFSFAALPSVNKEQIHLRYGGGIILVVGDLSPAWGLDDALLLSRETIRTAQEMGINILHFSWKRRQIMQLLSAGTQIAASSLQLSTTKSVFVEEGRRQEADRFLASPLLPKGEATAKEKAEGFIKKGIQHSNFVFDSTYDRIAQIQIKILSIYARGLLQIHTRKKVNYLELQARWVSG